jgi:hypothetical protein
MITLNSKNASFYNVLFSNNKVIKDKDSHEKNISEELLTIRTLVLVQQPKNEAQETAQLEKILSACRLQKEDYKVERNINSWSFYRQMDRIKEVILFGITEKDLNLDLQFNNNQINKFDERVFIKTASLAEIMANQLIKNELWQNALKPHFAS